MDYLCIALITVFKCLIRFGSIVQCISRNAGSYVLLIQEESNEDTSDR